MADERISSIVGPQPFDELDRLKAGIKEVVDGIAGMAQASRGAEFNLKGAADLKDTVVYTNQLVDANGKLTSSVQELSKAQAQFNDWKARSNGQTNPEMAGTGKIIRLNIDLSKSVEARAKAEKAQSAARIQQLKEEETQLKRTQAASGSTGPALDPTTLKYQSDRLNDLRKGYALLTAEERNNAEIGGVVLNRIVELDAAQKASDAAQGVYRRNVGNYSSALTGYANTLRGLRGPTKLLGEAIGVGAMEADQFRLVLEHSFQGLAAFFRGKEAAAAAQTEETAAVVAGTVATTANTVATEATVVVTETATVAMKAFRIAIASTGIGLLLVGIGYLVYKFLEYKEALKLAILEHEVYNKALDSTDYKTAIEGTARLAENIKLAKDGKIAAIPVIEEYNKSIGEAAGKVTTLGDAEEGLIKNRNAYIQMMFYKAAAAEAYKEAAEKAVKAQISLSDVGQAPGAGAFLMPKLIPGQFTADVNRQHEASEQQKQADRLFDIGKGYVEKMAGLGLDPTLTARVQPGSVAALRQQIQLVKEKIDTEKVGSTQQIADTKTLTALEKQLKDIEGHPEKGKAPHDQTNEKLKAENDLTTALFDQMKLRSDRSAKEQKAIADDETNNLQKRADANDNYTFERLNMAGLESAKEQAVIREKLAKISEIESKSASTRTEQEKKLHLDKAALEVDLKNVTEKYEGVRTDIIADQTKFQTELIKKYAKEAEDAIKQAEKNIKGVNAVDGGGDNGKFETEAQRDFFRKKREDEANTTIQVEKEIRGVLDDSFNSKISQYDAEIAKIEEKKKIEIDAINASGIAQAQKTQKIAAIEAQAAAQSAQLAQQKKEEQKKQARFDKDANIAILVEETAVAVVRALGAKPYTAANIAQAELVGAIGLAQILHASTAKLPEYEDGVENHPGGPAKMFEGNKSELVIEPDGNTWIGNKEGIYDLAAGSKVISNEELMQLTRMYTVGIPMLFPQRGGMDTSRLEGKMDELRTTIQNKSEAHINITEGGFSFLVKQGSSRQKYISKHVNWK